MKTIQELEQYLEENCYSFQELTIGCHFAYEGLVVEHCALGYCIFSSERGKKRLLKAFQAEEELVNYTLSKLDKDPWSKAHMAAFTFDQKQIQKAESELKWMGIQYKRNDIPNFRQWMGIQYKRNDIPNFRQGQTAYRIFVFGRDILRLEQFKQQYMQR